jgi:PIN domain nuclease of toxin-antitoxin system
MSLSLLVDTHALLWFEAGDRRLSRVAREAIEDEENEPVISTASVWEMALKASHGRLTLPTSVAAWVAEKTRSGYRLLAITGADAAAVETLPWHHRDPFDRLLAAQAIAHGYRLVSRDRIFRKYGLETLW